MILDRSAVCVICGTLFFTLVNRALHWATPQSASTTPHQAWKWRNIATSLVHSTITGVAAPLLLWSDKRLLADVLHGFSPLANLVLAMSVGYFVYDFRDMYVYHELAENGKQRLPNYSALPRSSLASNSAEMQRPLRPIDVFGDDDNENDSIKRQRVSGSGSSEDGVVIASRWTNGLLYHHACVIFCFGNIILARLCIPLAVVALLVEINSVFLHLRQLMIIQAGERRRAVEASAAYAAVAVANLATIAVCRFAVMAWMAVWVWCNGHNMPSFFVVLGGLGLFFIFVMTTQMTAKIVRRDWSLLSTLPRLGWCSDLRGVRLADDKED